MTRVTVHGHLGELLQGGLGPSGPVALITLPSPCLHVELSGGPGAFALEQSEGEAIAPAQLLRLFAHFGQAPTGRWRLRAKMPIGAGAGASTASLLAFCRALSPKIAADDFARLALSLEGASDPLAEAAPERLLWASREGRGLLRLPPLPQMRVVGGFAGPGERTDPRDANFPDITDLVGSWPEACRDPKALGALVSESSRRSMALRGKAGYARLESLARRHGAYGVAIAHTGSARGVLLPPERDPAPLLAELGAAGWTHLHSHLIGETHA